MNKQINEWTKELVEMGYPEDAARSAAVMRWNANRCTCGGSFTYYDDRDNYTAKCISCDKPKEDQSHVNPNHLPESY